LNKKIVSFQKRSFGSKGIINILIGHGHKGKNAAYNGAASGKKSNPAVLGLVKGNMKGRNLVNEKDPWQATAGSRINAAEMLGNGELIGLYFSAVEEAIFGGYDFDVVLIHGVGVLDGSGLGVELVYGARVVLSESEFVDGVGDVEALECVEDDVGEGEVGFMAKVFEGAARGKVEVSSS